MQYPGRKSTITPNADNREGWVHVDRIPHRDRYEYDPHGNLYLHSSQSILSSPTLIGLAVPAEQVCDRLRAARAYTSLIVSKQVSDTQARRAVTDCG
jgi:hypothetical protein